MESSLSLIAITMPNILQHQGNDLMLFCIVTKFYRIHYCFQICHGGSFNMLTWQRVVEEEKAPDRFAIVEDILVEKHILMAANSDVSCYDVHDGKIIYLLTQHALFNCKYHPFLLCKCRRGEGVFNTNNKLILLMQQEKVDLY